MKTGGHSSLLLFDMVAEHCVLMFRAMRGAAMVTAMFAISACGAGVASEDTCRLVSCFEASCSNWPVESWMSLELSSVEKEKCGDGTVELYEKYPHGSTATEPWSFRIQ